MPAPGPGAPGSASALRSISCAPQFYLQKAESCPLLSWFQSLAIRGSRGFNPSPFPPAPSEAVLLLSSSRRGRGRRCTIPAGAVNFGDSCAPLKIASGHGTYLRLILEPVGTQMKTHTQNTRTAATYDSGFWRLILQRKAGAAERLL